ncbi:MAG: glycosyltransferase family 9 protein [Burkholderiaceae bacterium]|nr:glycosyltransferase family 9 protein [Burkholderiaceae bacterium]
MAALSIEAVSRARAPCIAVFRALQLGDLLCSVPVLRALRHAHPHARIALIGLPSSAAFAQRFDRYIDEWIEFPGAVGLPEQAPRGERLPAFFASVRARRFNLALQLHGRGNRTNGIVRMMGAKRFCGFVPDSAVGAGDAVGTGDDFVRWPDDGPEIERLLRIVDRLGIERRGSELEFPVREHERRAWRRLARRRGLDPQRLVLVHPGARFASRRWPVERYAELADRLALRGWQIAITGSADEMQLAASMRRAMRTQAADLSGATDLGELGAAIESCRLLVCNDTGVSHVAIGVGTRSLVVASGSEIRRWRPLDRQLHPMLAVDLDCRPCVERVCPRVGHPCATAIGVDAVFALALHQLALGARSLPALAPASA